MSVLCMMKSVTRRKRKYATAAEKLPKKSSAWKELTKYYKTKTMKRNLRPMISLTRKGRGEGPSQDGYGTSLDSSANPDPVTWMTDAG